MLNHSTSRASSAQLPGWEWEEVLQPTHSGNTLKTWSQSCEAGGAQTSMEKFALPPKEVLRRATEIQDVHHLTLNKPEFLELWRDIFHFLNYAGTSKTGEPVFHL